MIRLGNTVSEDSFDVLSVIPFINFSYFLEESRRYHPKFNLTNLISSFESN
jgi:hypothetical protein